MVKTVKIELTQGFNAIIDCVDKKLIDQYKWHIQKAKSTCYAQARTKQCDLHRLTILMHRLIMGLEKGDKRQVDHINHNGLDNRRCNLRIVDRVQQNIHARKQSRTLRGVYKRVKNRIVTYDASICINGRKTYLGSFDTELEAAMAYDAQAKISHGEFAILNFLNITQEKRLEIIQGEDECKRRKQNLRLSKKTSRYIGVQKYQNKWRAFISVKGKAKHIAYAATEREAALLRDRYVIKHDLKHKLNFQEKHK